MLVNPLYIVVILTMRLISIAIIMILLVLAPKIMIMMGPKATFGSEFSIVKNGSNI